MKHETWNVRDEIMTDELSMGVEERGSPMREIWAETLN